MKMMLLFQIGFFLSLLSSAHAAGATDAELLWHIKKTYQDWEPNALVDIGANVGKYSTDVRKAYPNTKIMMFEANDDHTEKLKSVADKLGNADYHIGILTGKDGDTIEYFNNPKTHTGNSIFQEQTKFFSDVKPVKRTTARLDTLMTKSKFIDMEEVDIIKVDVQGAELLVLSGGLETLQKATFVMFEASTVEYNAGGACFWEVDALLRDNGFFLYHHAGDMIHPKLFNTFGLGQWDLLYVRPDSDRLPSQLKSKQPNFCGARRERKQQSEVASALPQMDQVSSAIYNAIYQANMDTAQMNPLPQQYFIYGLFLGIIFTYLFTKNHQHGQQRKFN